MSRMIRMDRSGHTVVAEWTAQDLHSVETARTLLAEELALGYLAVATTADGRLEQVRELPLEAPTVILRRPIAGG